MAADGSLTKHGFPRGYRFDPTHRELLSILSRYIETGGALDPPHDSIFHNIRILDYHPRELHERYNDDAEHRYIYFLSERQFQQAGARVAVPEDKDQKEPRPVRMAKGGGWKPSGGAQVLRLLWKKGGFVAGRMVTMVFYDRVVGGEPVKSNWGMHEFVVPVDKEMTSPPTKYTRFRNLALYRLYILKSGDMESDNGAAGSSSQMMPKGYDPYAPSTSVAPCPPLQPWGIFTGKKALAAGASTSHMSPPQQQQLHSAQHAQYCHYPHAFVGATAAGAGAQPHAHNMMPVIGDGLLGNRGQFAVLSAPAPAPAPAPVPPDAAIPWAAHQAPTAAMHGAGQDTTGHFGAKCSPSPPPTIGSSSAEQHATDTEEPTQAQFADCVRPMEAAAPQPPLEDDIDWDSLPELEFTFDELLGARCSTMATQAAERTTIHAETTTATQVAQAQFADSVRPMEAAPQPPLEDVASGVKDESMADDIDWDNFTFDELLGDSMLDDDHAGDGEDDHPGGDNYGHPGGAQQEPPAALSFGSAGACR